MGQIPSHYVPMSDMIRPQLVGVRPFVYSPTGLHSMQHSHHVNQHFNYPQQYPLRNQQPHQQIINYQQQQQTTREYQPQAPLPHNQLHPQQLPNQPQSSVVEIQQQTLVQNQQQHPNSLHSVAQHQQQVKVAHHQISFQQSQLNGNPLQQPCEMALSQRQQQEQLKQHSVARKELLHVEHKDEELSQKQLEDLTVKYQLEQQKRQQQQQQQEKPQREQQQEHHEQQQQEQQKQQQQQQQKLQQQQQQQRSQQQHQQQQQQQERQLLKLTKINQEMKATQLSKETGPTKEEHQKQEAQVETQQQSDKKAKQHNTEAVNQTEKSSHELDLHCSENHQKHLQQSHTLTSTSEQTEAVSAQAESVSVLKDVLNSSTTIDERQLMDGGNRHVSNEDNTEVKRRKAPTTPDVHTTDQNQSNLKITEGIKERKQPKQEIKSAIRILSNAKMEDSKQVVSLKKDGTIAPVALKKTTDTKQTKQNDQLQQERLQQKQTLLGEKEHQKDLRKKKHEKKLLLPPKEKLVLLQQQIKRQAEALERLTQCKTMVELKQERNKGQDKMQKKTSSVKSSLRDTKASEKTSSEVESDSVVRSEVQLLKKCEGTKSLLPSKKGQDSLKLPEKEEESAPRRSPSKIRLAQRMDIHDDSEIKEKRPRLETDESSTHKFTENITSTNKPYKTVASVADLNSTKLIGNHENDEINSNPCRPEGVVSMAPIVKAKPEIDQRSKSPKKTSEFSTTDEVSSSLCSLMNQMSLKDKQAQTTTTKDELKQITPATITTTTTPSKTVKGLSKNIDNWCKESNGDGAKEMTGKMIPQSNERDKVKTREQPHCKPWEINCQLSNKQNMNVVVQENLNERPVVTSDTATVNEKKLPKLVGQEKQNSSPVVVVDSKAVNVLSSVKMSERNFKIELGPTFNQTGIIRPIPKLPLQSISSHGVIPDFSAMSIPSQFSHPHPQVNNMQQFQTFTNNQFQPIVRAEAGMGRKVNFVFNHPILPPMPSAHILPQNDTFTTNTHYDPVMVPSPLLIGVPGMTGHTSHHIARPIPHIPAQPWQTMPLPHMMHPRMTHFPPAYPPVLPNIGVNRNAPEFYPKIPERLPKIQPDAAFHLPYNNNLTNMQMRFTGRNLTDEASFHMPTFKIDSNPIAQFKNDFSTDRPVININNRDILSHTAVNATNIGKDDEIPTMHSTSAQASDNKSGIPSKVVNGLTYEQLVREQGNSNKNENKMNAAELLANKMETKYFGDKGPALKPMGNFRQSVKVPTFNRTVRELISVPFTSDESRLLYLLKKRHQGHPIAQEWLFICNGLLTSHFRKLWDPPCGEEELQNDFDEVSQDKYTIASVAKPARLLVMLCKYFCVHGPRKQSISKEMNNDNDLKFA